MSSRLPRSFNSSKAPSAASPNKAGASPLGLIAGWGEFPHLVAEAAHRLGRNVIAVGFRGETFDNLQGRVNELHWISIGQLGRMLSVFKRAGVREAVMAGMIRHRRIFSGLKLDWQAVRLLAGLRDKRADSILKAVAGFLEKNGVCLVSPLPWLSEHLPGPGVLTRRRPTPGEKKDIAFGFRMAKHIAAADIGQTVVVKNGAVVAVEAMEGTDVCLARSGQLARAGAVAVKVAKPGQDWRFDTPVLGPGTIAAMKQGGVKTLAFEAKTALLLRKQETLQAANRSQLTLLAM